VRSGPPATTSRKRLTGDWSLRSPSGCKTAMSEAPRHGASSIAGLHAPKLYRTGADVQRRMPRLATYLGHVHVNDTYWYIESCPELLALATRRLESPKEVES